MLAAQRATEPAVPSQQLRSQAQRGKEREAVAGFDIRSPGLLRFVTAGAQVVAAVTAAMPIFEHHFLQDQPAPQIA